MCARASALEHIPIQRLQARCLAAASSLDQFPKPALSRPDFVLCLRNRRQIRCPNGRRRYLSVLECEVEDAELENWLKSYIDTKPQEALDLLAKILPLAVEKLKAED